MSSQSITSTGISQSIAAFAQFLRRQGLNVGIQETADALVAANVVKVYERRLFKNALKTIFCTSPEERQLFEKLFALYWDGPAAPQREKNKSTVQGLVSKNANASLVMLGQGKTGQEENEAKNVSGASETERLKKTDFARLSESESKQLEAIALRLFKQMAVRLRKNRKDHLRQGRINLRRTIRHSIPSGGEPLELFRKTKLPQKQRLVVLLDVSGSMDKYSFFLLRFICALSEHFRQLEAFVFSTSLVPISRALRQNRLELILSAISEQADNWSGGTRIGTSLQTFYEAYGKRTLNGSPVVLILSDGLETGDTRILDRELHKIQQRSKKIIWLNPLKGMKDYQPLAKGMKAALASIDDFRAAHNLESLLELENILSNV